MESLTQKDVDVDTAGVESTVTFGGLDEHENQRIALKRPRRSHSIADSEESDESSDTRPRLQLQSRNESWQPVQSPDTPRRVPAHPIPWAYEFPELFDYYLRNTPDFTGLALYRLTFYTNEFRSSAARNPMAFSIQALIAESARFYNRRPESQLRKLKGYLLSMINEALRDVSRHSSVDLISTVSALVLYDMVFDTKHGNPAAHRAGLKRLVDLYGGIHRVEPYRTRRMIEFTDHAYSYFYQAPLNLTDDIAYGTRAASRAEHPIRLAIQPTHSNLPSWRLRNHIMYSYGAPVVFVLATLGDIDHLATEFLHQPYRRGPGRVAFTISQLEERLEQIEQSHANGQLPRPEFSDLDCTRHDQTLRCALTCSTIYLADLKLKYTDRTPKTAEHMDFLIQKLHLLILNSNCVIDLNIRAWALFTSTALIKKSVQRDLSIEIIGKQCSELGLTTWSSVESFLRNIFLCTPLQQNDCGKLWGEIAHSQRMLNS